MGFFVRYLPGVSGTVPREIIALRNSGGTTRVQLRQQSATNAAAPAFQLEVNFGATPTILTTSTYALSKLYIDIWYYFMISIVTVLSQTSHSA
jgi:hypothetical protein